MDTVSSDHSKVTAHMNSKMLGNHVQDLHKFKLDKIPAWRGEVDTKSSVMYYLPMVTAGPTNI